MLQLRKLIGIKLVSFVIVCFFVLLPFSFVTNYVDLSEDDYGRAILFFDNYCVNYFVWLKQHNGRYINAMISLLPLYSLPILKTVLGLNFLITPWVIKMFVQRLSITFGVRLRNINSYLVAVVLFGLMIFQMPLLVEYFYWMAATTVYSFSFLSFLMICYFLFDVRKGSKKAVVGAALFTIVATGSNEIFLLLTNYVIFISLILFWISHKKLNVHLLAVQIVALVSSSIVILATGSSNRRDNYAAGGDIVDSIVLSLKNTVSILFNQFTTLNDVLILIAIGSTALFVATQTKVSKNLQSLNPMLLLLLSIVALFLIFFTPNYAMGSVSYNNGRVGNLIQILLLFILFTNCLNFIIYYRIHQTILPFVNSLFSRIAVLVLLFATTLTSVNTQNLYLDFYDGSFARLEQDRKLRVETVKINRSNHLTIPPLYKTRTLPYDGITTDPIAWQNRYYTEYINQKYDPDLLSIRLGK
ncbi:hypothetical protein SAMN05192588_0269 [Nonlabens sp. Hel1_33_55]|uniref:DUF6056 family protein n=1 Tax=Nonlabens sp. Hel1_33_55 TaxID=1336802 RepID=UPI000875E395|nr:DUF6056 family protein [Nonlabens sp. Hel1_33_55]SCX92049.1 hypothetical protein SAMN05192588_0269 [Nonlabens sp. Hel1_33_55]